MELGGVHTYDHYAYALVALVGTFGMVAVIVWAMVRAAGADGLGWLRGVAPPFINIIGVLFALTLAFIANDTWSAHDQATRAVHREADALSSLLVLSARLDDPLRTELRTVVVGYARASADEWRALAQRETSSQAGERASDLLLAVSGPEINRSAGANVQRLMLDEAARLRDNRHLRIGLSQMHVNPLKWMGMAFLGLMTLLSVAVVHIDNVRAAIVALVLFALSSAPTAAIVLIQGNPFQQPSFVTPAPILAAVGR
jgi:hypothetical protein